MRVTRRDAFGNLTAAPSAAGGQYRFSAEVVGPGKVDAEALELGDGTCELRLRALTAGSYDVSIAAVAVAVAVEIAAFASEVTVDTILDGDVACVITMSNLRNITT